MNEVDQLQALKSTVARLETEVMGMRTSTRDDSSLVRARIGQRWALWLGAAGLCSLPMLGWAAVELTEFQAGDPIVAAEVNDNFSGLAGAVSDLEVFAFQDAAVSSSEFCLFADAPCSFADYFAVRVTSTAQQVIRVDLMGASGVGSDAPGRIIAGDNSDNLPGVVNARLILERRTEPAVDWEAVSSQAVYFDGAGGLNDFGVAIPCSAVGFLDTPPAGEHTYRVSAEFADANPAQNLEFQNCQAVASMAGRVSK
jgi:hypothetical protein